MSSDGERVPSTAVRTDDAFAEAVTTVVRSTLLSGVECVGDTVPAHPDGAMSVGE
jgi:hypothetical protein